MDYTELSDEFVDSYYERFKFPEKFSVSICREDPVKFAYFMLGKTLWKHQTYLIDAVLNHQYNVWCLPRQTGKSVTIDVMALWAAWFNMYNKTVKTARIDKGCSVYIISRTEDQAKEMILKIRALIRDGDAHMSKLLRSTSKHMTDFFSSSITQPDNLFQITFKNGGFIKAVPPTDTIRGKSADYVFIDEAAFLKNDNPDKLYAEAIEPTISQTNGKLILSSTPRGQQGFFYKILDPFGHFVGNDFNKVWFHYTILDAGHYRDKVKQIEKERRSKGEGKSFEQEYEAKFVTASESFFDAEKIDEICDSKNKFEDDKRNEYVLGVDYGMVASRTAIAMSRLDDEGKIITGYTKRFRQGKDLNDIVPFIQGLMTRYNINKLYVDDCPEGYAINQQMMNKGWNVELFNFTREKAEKYCAYRSKLNQGKVGLYPDKDLMMEMKGLQQEETMSGKLKIFKGGGLTDDLCDAVVMSAAQWVGDEMENYELILV